LYSSDTDFTPFDKGAYASSTTYISGAAVARAAKEVAERIKFKAAKMFNLMNGSIMAVNPSAIVLRDSSAIAPDGRKITLADIALETLHHTDQEQIMAVPLIILRSLLHLSNLLK
jgi:putative selenate reductase molybdopterin-binding subunit